MENIKKLAQAYNLMCQISTKGEDTIAMANCIVMIRETIESMQAIANQKQLEQKSGSGK